MHFFSSVPQTLNRLLLVALTTSAVLGAAETDPVKTPPAPPAPAPAPPGVPALVPFLGVRFDENSIALDQEPGMPINEVVVGSTAQTLGLEAGDRLLTVNGKPVEKPDQLKAVLGGAKVGDPITVEFLHAGKRVTANGTLSERPKPAALAKEVDRLNQKLSEVKDLAAAQKREPSLAEILQQLKDIETGLPRAVAAFKKQYPNGDFDIRIQVVITSDRTAANPIELNNTPAAGAKDEKSQDGKAPYAAPDAKTEGKTDAKTDSKADAKPGSKPEVAPLPVPPKK